MISSVTKPASISTRENSSIRLFCYTGEVQQRSAVALLLTLVIVFCSLSFLPSVLYSALTYDVAKMLWLLKEAPTLEKYLKDLGWLIGMGSQVYFLGEITAVTVSKLKLISYLFTISAFICCFWLVVYRDTNTFRRLLMSGSLILFFNGSTSLSYLAAYEVAIYAEAFLLGIPLFTFLATDSHKIIESGTVRSRLTFCYGIIFLIAACIDFRFSLYLFSAFVVLAIRYRRANSFPKTLIVLAIVYGIAVAVPFVLQLLITPNIAGFRPAHYDSLMYLGGMNFELFANYVAKAPKIFIQSLASKSPSAAFAVSTMFFLGCIYARSLNENYILPFYYFALVISVQFVGSLFAVIPFGTIRYSTFLLPIIVIFYLYGVQCVLQLVEKPRFLLDGSLVIALCGLLVFHSVKTEALLSLAARKLASESRVISELTGSVSDGPIYCDMISEKTSKALNVGCDTVSSWNITRKSGESADYVSALRGRLKDEKRLSLLLSRPISDPHFGYLRDLLQNLNFEGVKTINGSHHYWYVYTPVVSD